MSDSTPPAAPNLNAPSGPQAILFNFAAAVRGNGADPTIDGARRVSTAFGGALAIGGLGASVGLIPGDLAIAITTAFIVPVLATVGFCLWGWSQGFHLVGGVREKYADNCYYLGFLFNLIALVVGFLPAGFGEIPEAQHIMRTFGMALVTTAIGLGFRTFILQQATDELEDAAEMESELRAYVTAVSRSTKAIVTDLDKLRSRIIATQQSNADGLVDALKQRLGSELAVVTDRLGADLAAAIARADKAAGRLDTSVREAAARLDASVGRAEGAWGTLSNEVGQGAVAFEGLRNIGSHAGTELTAATEALRFSVESLKETFAQASAGVTEQLVAATSNVREATAGMGELGGAGARLGVSAEQIQATLNEARSSLRLLTDVATSASSAFRSASDAAVGIPTALEARLTELGQKLQTEGAQTAETFSRDLKSAQSELASIVEEFNEQISKLRTDIAASA